MPRAATTTMEPAFISCDGSVHRKRAPPGTVTQEERRRRGTANKQKQRKDPNIRLHADLQTRVRNHMKAAFRLADEIIPNWVEKVYLGRRSQGNGCHGPQVQLLERIGWWLEWRLKQAIAYRAMYAEAVEKVGEWALEAQDLGKTVRVVKDKWVKCVKDRWKEANPEPRMLDKERPYGLAAEEQSRDEEYWNLWKDRYYAFHKPRIEPSSLASTSSGVIEEPTGSKTITHQGVWSAQAVTPPPRLQVDPEFMVDSPQDYSAMTASPSSSTSSPSPDHNFLSSPPPRSPSPFSSLTVALVPIPVLSASSLRSTSASAFSSTTTTTGAPPIPEARLDHELALTAASRRSLAETTWAQP